MTIHKAIEILKELPGNVNNVLDYDQLDAIKLLIEAGKRELYNRTDVPYLITGTLPGETKE